MADAPVAEHKRRVLVVDDETVMGEMVVAFLGAEGYDATWVASGDAALKRLEQDLFDVVLLDLNLPGMHGLNVLSAAPALQTDAQFVVMTADGSVDTAVEAMKLGAFDYIVKPFDPQELLVTLDRALRDTELRREVARLRRRAGTGARARIVGKAPAMERMFDLIERVAPTRATVLITGETGTGKELVARAVHELSPRSSKPFVPVNCSAVAESLLESELFGHMKGSFTGAIATRRGLFEEAHGGTLFLDEIDAMPMSIQVKLLRVIQERRIQRVGGNQEIPIDFRLVAATRTPLEREVAANRFREDLFYRLNVFPITVPPLRERKEDIPLLAHHFRTRFAEEMGIDPPELPPSTLDRMMAYDWPGNVRELENYIERAVILYSGSRSMPFDPPGADNGRMDQKLLERARRERWTMERLEQEYILATLADVDGHQARAADLLGISRRTLYRKLQRYRTQGAKVPAGGRGD